MAPFYKLMFEIKLILFSGLDCRLCQNSCRDVTDLVLDRIHTISCQGTDVIKQLAIKNTYNNSSIKHASFGRIPTAILTHHSERNLARSCYKFSFLLISSFMFCGLRASCTLCIIYCCSEKIKHLGLYCTTCAYNSKTNYFQLLAQIKSHGYKHLFD